MSEINLYLVRHGETDCNLRNVYYGAYDISLNKNGIYESILLKERIKDLKIDLIITSSLKRTIETAEIINTYHNADIINYKELNEFNFGVWENKSYKQIENIDKANYIKWCEDYKNFIIPDGESYNIFYERVIKKFKSIIEDEYDKNILLVGHNGTLKIIISYLLNLKDGFWNFNFKQSKYSFINITDNHVTVEFLNR